MRALFVLLVLALALAACGGPAPDATGAEIFAQVCARCHGAELQGRVGPALGPGSHAAEQPDEYLLTTVTRGRGGMPSFSRTLSETQIAAVVAYLRERQAS